MFGGKVVLESIDICKLNSLRERKNIIFFFKLTLSSIDWVPIKGLETVSICLPTLSLVLMISNKAVLIPFKVKRWKQNI